MTSMRVEVRLLALPVRYALTTAHDSSVQPLRKLAVVRLESDVGQVGWGECSALNDVGYSSESAQTAYDLLTSDALLAAAGRGDELRLEAPMATAALEMAELDLRLRSLGVSLASYLGVQRTIVPAGAVISTGPIDATIAAVACASAEGYQRVKLKVVPRQRSGVDPSEIVGAVVEGFPGLDVQVDANASFDASSAPQVEAMVTAGASAVEQPFPIHDLAIAAELVDRGNPILADEAATSLEAVQALVVNRACTGVVIKSSRLGGLVPAMELLGWCLREGVPAAAGGMQESGLGRAALAVVAAHEACTLTGDVSPARRWLSEDPWDDLEMRDGEITVPTEPGVARPPDRAVLDRFTIARDERTVGPAL
jgi:O-succinylbenzoate synthase